MRELIDKHDAIDALNKLGDDWYGNDEVKRGIHLSIGVVYDLPIKPISYQDCANALLMMWMDNVLTDGEYYKIMDKLNSSKEECE